MPKGANVFQPPPSGGTASPQRASRWQAANQDSNEQARDPGRDTSTTSGKSKNKDVRSKSSKSSGNKDEKEDRRKVPEHDHTVWYGEPGHDSLGPGGMLYKHITKGVVRSGMCNPPQNPQVAQALLADLNKWEVRPHPRITKQEEKPKNSRPTISLQTPQGGHTGLGASDSTTVLKSAGNMVAGTHGKSLSSTAPPLASSGSASSSRLQSPVPMRGSRVSSAASAYRSTNRGTLAKPRKSSNKEAWEQFELALTQEGKMKKPPLDSGPEGEVKWKSFKLKKQARELGYQIDQADAVDLCKLTIYHNSFTRRSMHGTAASGFQSTASSSLGHSRQVKDIRSHLVSTLVDPDSVSPQTVTQELERTLLKCTPKLPAPPLEEAPSAERYLELADAALKSGPYRLQAMAQQANISVLSGMKPLERIESPSPEQGVEVYDPLFSSPNTSPRSSRTGKPLPVPYWGRSGSAPLLKM